MYKLVVIHSDGTREEGKDLYHYSEAMEHVEAYNECPPCIGAYMYATLAH